MLAEIYRRAQYLSLDIVLGAVILLRFFSSILSVYPSWSVYVLLGSSVWLIYTIDHLRDASKAQNSDRGRYQFHSKHSKSLKVVIGMVLITCLICLFYTSPIILVAGCTLVILSGVYLLIQHLLAKWGMKELYVSIIYTSGILLAPFVLAENVLFEVFFLLLLLTFLNLILFSWFEKADDEADGFKSIATTFSDYWLQRLILIAISVGISFSFLLETSNFSLYFLVAFMAYAFLFLARKRVRKNHLYRVIGDGIFLLPILFEWL